MRAVSVPPRRLYEERREISSKINRIVSCVPSMLDGLLTTSLVFSPSSRLVEDETTSTSCSAASLHHSQSRLTLNYM